MEADQLKKEPKREKKKKKNARHPFEGRRDLLQHQLLQLSPINQGSRKIDFRSCLYYLVRVLRQNLLISCKQAENTKGIRSLCHLLWKGDRLLDAGKLQAGRSLTYGYFCKKVLSRKVSDPKGLTGREFKNARDTRQSL